MDNIEKLKQHLQQILTSELRLAVYHLKFTFAEDAHPSGAMVGHAHFRPSTEYIQAFYDLTFHNAILPMSKLPLDQLLALDLTDILPHPTDTRYPEHCLGLITILDQSRLYTTGYGMRYTCSFFDPISEKLGRQLIALPEDLRPDGKQAWLSRGYSVEDWLARTLWFWGPLVHSDNFMTADRQRVKDWLHSMRAAVESHCGHVDPFALLEAQDDLDTDAFQRIMLEGPPLRSYVDEEREAAVSDYAFWWIRILNSHFAITDMCGHYPFWIRWKGQELNQKDREYLETTDKWLYDPADEPIFQQVRQDHLNGVWRDLEPNPNFEKDRKSNGVAAG